MLAPNARKLNSFFNRAHWNKIMAEMHINVISWFVETMMIAMIGQTLIAPIQVHVKSLLHSPKSTAVSFDSWIHTSVFLVQQVSKIVVADGPAPHSRFSERLSPLSYSILDRKSVEGLERKCRDTFFAYIFHHLQFTLWDSNLRHLRRRFLTSQPLHL